MSKWKSQTALPITLTDIKIWCVTHFYDKIDFDNISEYMKLSMEKVYEL
jgi:hypothetical protein